MACGSLSAGRQLSYDQIKALWVQAGGDPMWAPAAAAVALAESGGWTQASNTCDPYGGSFGLWQINGAHDPGIHQTGSASQSFIAGMYDPAGNAAQAVSVSNNGRNWGPWQGDPVGNYLLHNASPLSDTEAQHVLSTSGRGGGTASGAGLDASGQPADPVGPQYLGLENPGRSIISLPLVGTIVDAAQARKIKGYSVMVAGGAVLGLGVLMLAAAGFGSTGAAKVLQGVPGPVGVASRASVATAGGQARRRPARASSSSSTDPAGADDAFEGGRQAGRAEAERESADRERAEGFASDRDPSRRVPARRPRRPGEGARPRAVA